MKNKTYCGLAAVILAGGLGLASAQEAQVKGRTEIYRGGLRPTTHDVYCSGYISTAKLPYDLRVIHGEDAAGRLIFSLNDFIYLNHGADSGVQAGQEYLVVRPIKDTNYVAEYNRQHRDYWKGGYIIRDIGRVRIEVVHAASSTARITHACDDFNVGDLLVPFAPRPAPDYKAAAKLDRFAPASGKATGRVIGAKDFHAATGENSIVYLKLGTGEGARVGDYVRFYRAATHTEYEGFKRMKDGIIQKYPEKGRGYYPPKNRHLRDLPREVLGEAIILWADERNSTALITSSLREIHPGDWVEIE